jgi:hypothetical protein
MATMGLIDAPASADVDVARDPDSDLTGARLGVVSQPPFVTCNFVSACYLYTTPMTLSSAIVTFKHCCEVFSKNSVVLGI